MSAFEVACWNWHQENVNQVMMESGAAGLALYSASNRLSGVVRTLFIRAIDSIYQTFKAVEMEKYKARKNEEKG